MKKISLAPLFFIGLSFATIISCQKDDIKSFEQAQDPIDEKVPDLSGMSELGEKLINPYSVTNMTKALKNLAKKGKYAGKEKLRATHLYVKFKPKNEEELWSLKNDTTLTYYDYPLDREISRTGDFYHDPEVPIGRPTYQYVSLPVTKDFPEGVGYEILEELYIPDEEGDFKETSKQTLVSKEHAYALVDESLRLTGNLDENEIGSSLTAKRKWRPSGRVRVYDHEVRNYVGVSGVKVSARRWFTTHRGFTDNNGNFSCDGRFRRDANYDIKWDRSEYSIRSGSFFQADLKGPKRRGSWNVDLGNRNSNVVNDKQQYYALIHQAALDYYYGSRFGLTSPPRNAFLKKQMKIAARDVRGTSSYSHLRAELTFSLSAQVHVKSYRRQSQNVYGTTIHELTHAQHWVVAGKKYNDLVIGGYFNPLNTKNNQAKRLLETWPTTVETMFTVYRYRNRFGIRDYTYGFLENFQDQETLDDLHYTSAGWDMIDNINQRTDRNFGNGDDAWPIDRVRGYTLPQLQNGLKGANEWVEWRDNIKRLYNNGTERYLDELFANWE